MIRCKHAGLLWMTIALLGCGGSAAPKEDLVPVSGTVKFGGKPVEGVSVSFVPAGKTAGQGASGVTNEAGEFELEHNASHKPGIPVGDYQVNLSKWVMRDGKPLPEGKAPHLVGAVNMIPQSWSRDGAGKDILKVPAGGTKFDFDVPEK